MMRHRILSLSSTSTWQELCTLFKEKQSESKFSEIGIDLWSKRTGWFMIYVIHDDITRTRVNLHMKLIHA